MQVKWDAQAWKVVEHRRHDRTLIGRPSHGKSNSSVGHNPTKSINQIGIKEVNPNAAMGQSKETVNTDRQVQGYV